MGVRESLVEFIKEAAVDTLGRVTGLAGLVHDSLQTFEEVIKADLDDGSSGGAPTPDGQGDGPGTPSGFAAQAGQGQGQVPTDPADKDPKSLFWDPFAVIEQLGYKERASSITYATLKAMVYRMPIVQAVIQTRINQLASFCYPQHDRHQLGFRIGLRDSEAEPTGVDRKWMKECEGWLERTGVTYNPRGRLNFEKFMRMVAWDSLVYDQTCIEVVPDMLGRPCEWYGVDAASVRIADNQRAFIDEDDIKQVRYVQVYDGMIVNDYTQQEMIFGVRNPRTDMRLHGYGVSELEMLVTVITGLLYAWQYNQGFFSQGSAQKGLLNIKGTMSEGNLRQFRRHWYQMLNGVENAWRTPILNNEEGIEWVSLQNSNKDMEFNAWMDFLIKVACSVYSMDPMEVNFKYGNAGQKSTMNEGNNKDKITESKERGLRPLLRFFTNEINANIIWPTNENFEFRFVGLDALNRQDVADLNAKRVKTSMTVNELRAEDDKPPIEGGDVILDPVFFQFQQAKAGIDAQNAQNQTQGMGPQFAVPGMDGGDGTEASDAQSSFNYETEQPGEGHEAEDGEEEEEQPVAKSQIIGIRRRGDPGMGVSASYPRRRSGAAGVTPTLPLKKSVRAKRQAAPAEPIRKAKRSARRFTIERNL